MRTVCDDPWAIGDRKSLSTKRRGDAHTAFQMKLSSLKPSQSTWDGREHGRETTYVRECERTSSVAGRIFIAAWGISRRRMPVKLQRKWGLRMDVVLLPVCQYVGIYAWVEYVTDFALVVLDIDFVPFIVARLHCDRVNAGSQERRVVRSSQRLFSAWFRAGTSKSSVRKLSHYPIASLGSPVCSGTLNDCRNMHGEYVNMYAGRICGTDLVFSKIAMPAPPNPLRVDEWLFGARIAAW